MICWLWAEISITLSIFSQTFAANRTVEELQTCFFSHTFVTFNKKIKIFTLVGLQKLFDLLLQDKFNRMTF